jgi:hypothetical protein
VSEHPLAGLRASVSTPAAPGLALVRNARKDGRPVASLQLVRHEGHCSVEAQVFGRSGGGNEARGPYNFATFEDASSFLDEAVDALTYLGCEIQ